MSQDEIAVMDGGKCILQVRGVRPFLQINTIFANIKTTNICPIMTKRIPLILKNI